MASIIKKAVADSISVDVDFSVELPAGITISSAAWTVSAGLTQASSATTTTVAQSVFSGGQDGRTYSATVAVTLSNTDILSRTLYISVGEVLIDQGRRNLAVPLDQMKHFLRVTHDQDDLKIAATTEAATSLIEGMTGRTLITKLIDRVYPRFLSKFEIPGQPVQAVASLKYWDSDGVRQTIGPESYRSFQTDGQMFIIAAVDFTWPSVADRSDAITVSWFAGYGDTSESIPSIAKEFVMMVTRYMYDNSDLTGPQPMWLRAMADAIKTGEVF